MRNLKKKQRQLGGINSLLTTTTTVNTSPNIPTYYNNLTPWVSNMMSISSTNYHQSQYHREDLQNALDYVVNLGEDVLHSLKSYTGFGYLLINNGLRDYFSGETNRLSETAVKFINNIDHAFKNAPTLTKPLTVYRGMRNFDHNWNNAIPYLSTTLKSNYASSLGDYLLVIEVQPGTRVLPLKKISAHEGEEEILLPRNGNIAFISHSFETIDYEQKEVVRLKFEQTKTSQINPLINFMSNEENIQSYRNKISSWYELPEWITFVLTTLGIPFAFYTYGKRSKK